MLSLGIQQPAGDTANIEDAGGSVSYFAAQGTSWISFGDDGFIVPSGSSLYGHPAVGISTTFSWLIAYP